MVLLYKENGLVVSNISNGEYFIVEERQMGQPAKPMSGINNVYRIYIEYLIKKKNINISKFRIILNIIRI